MAAVALMGWSNCDVFEDTFGQVGPAEYTPGDFFMHKFPGILALALVLLSKIETERDQVTAQIWLAFGLFLCWTFFHGKCMYKMYSNTIGYMISV